MTKLKTKSIKTIPSIKKDQDEEQPPPSEMIKSSPTTRKRKHIEESNKKLPVSSAPPLVQQLDISSGSKFNLPQNYIRKKYYSKSSIKIIRLQESTRALLIPFIPILEKRIIPDNPLRCVGSQIQMQQPITTSSSSITSTSISD